MQNLVFVSLQRRRMIIVPDVPEGQAKCPDRSRRAEARTGWCVDVRGRRQRQRQRKSADRGSRRLPCPSVASARPSPDGHGRRTSTVRARGRSFDSLSWCEGRNDGVVDAADPFGVGRRKHHIGEPERPKRVGGAERFHSRSWLTNGSESLLQAIDPIQHFVSILEWRPRCSREQILNRSESAIRR